MSLTLFKQEHILLKAQVKSSHRTKSREKKKEHIK